MTLETKESMQEALSHVSNDPSVDFFAMEAANINADIEYEVDKLIREGAGADVSTSSKGGPAASDVTLLADQAKVKAKNEMDVGASEPVTNVANSAKVQEATVPSKPSTVPVKKVEDPAKIVKDVTTANATSDPNKVDLTKEVAGDAMTSGTHVSRSYIN